ncbi:unnamed protein product, partial [Rotaria socialis]
YIFIFSTRNSFKKHLIFYDIHLFIQHEIHLRNILFSMKDGHSDPILIPCSKLNELLPPIIEATKTNVLSTRYQLFKDIDEKSYNYCTIASYLSTPRNFVLHQLNNVEIEMKERELLDRFKQEHEEASKFSSQLLEEEKSLSTQQQKKEKRNRTM